MAHKPKPPHQPPYQNPPQPPTPSQVVARLYASLEGAGGIQWLSFKDGREAPAIILVARGSFACDLMDTMMATVREAMEQTLKASQVQVQPKDTK